MLKSSVLNSMMLHPDLKTEIWQLATATPGWVHVTHHKLVQLATRYVIYGPFMLK